MTESTPPTGPDDELPTGDERPLEDARAEQDDEQQHPSPDVPDIMKQTTA